MSGPSAHPDDVDVFLAEDPDVLGHLQVCATCQARRQVLQAEQDAVRAALVPLGGPVPVPAAVQRGVEQALAREARDGVRPPVDGPAADRAAADGPTPDRAAADEPAPVDLGERRASRASLRARQWVAVAAAAAVVVVGAGVVLPRLGGPDGARSTSELQATGPAPEEGAEAPAGSPPAGAAGSAAGAGAGDASGVPAVPALPSDVLAVATSLQPSLGLVQSCGAALATELGAAVDAVADPAAPGREGVLVVVDVPGARQAWWLPSCDATRAQALGTSPVA